MSASQLDTRPTDATTHPEFTFADLRAAVLADRDLTIVVRAFVGLLTVVAAAILVLGFATQSGFMIVGGILTTSILVAALVAVTPALVGANRR